MELDEYQEQCLRTANLCLDETRRVLILTLGIAGEAGELSELMKKAYGHGHPLAKEEVSKEIGDVLWYCAVLANEFGLKLEHVARQNLEKLSKRYPDGFSSKRSIYREET